MKNNDFIGMKLVDLSTQNTQEDTNGVGELSLHFYSHLQRPFDEKILEQWRQECSYSNGACLGTQKQSFWIILPNLIKVLLRHF